MIHVNPSKTQNRRACDRCHQAKLKCAVETVNSHSRNVSDANGQTSIVIIFSPPSKTRVTKRQWQAQPQPLSRSSLSSPSDDTMSPTDYDMNGWSGVLDMSLDSDLNGSLEASLQATNSSLLHQHIDGRRFKHMFMNYFQDVWCT